MDIRRILRTPEVLVAVVSAGILAVSVFSFSAARPSYSFHEFARIHDPELRFQPLEAGTQNERIDISTFAGMPEKYVDAASQYVEAVCSAIKAEPITRRRYYHKDPPRTGPNPYTSYPDNANPIDDRNVVVPLTLLPRPDAVKTWASSAEARATEWRTEQSVYSQRGPVYGRSLIFSAGSMSRPPDTLPASPFEAPIPSWDAYVPEMDGTFFFQLGKLVLSPSYHYASHVLVDQSAELRLGEKQGAKLLAEFVTIPASLKNTRLWWTSIQNGAKTRQFLAYSLLDGNGAKHRKDRFQETARGPISPYVRRLTCKLHQPAIAQHDELLLPVPQGWPHSRFAVAQDAIDSEPHEMWCLDDWFAAQPHACWVVREAQDSKPLRESFLLMPASEASDRPPFCVALFAETEPQQLVAELARLHGVSAEAALTSQETMERLNTLYRQLRDFPLAK